jgi:hypothetical protein
MAMRYANCALSAASMQFLKIMGRQQLWMLKAHLNALGKEEQLEQSRRVR